MKDDEILSQIMEQGSEKDNEEKIKFSCYVNLKEKFNYKKITFIVTNKKIYSFRKKNFK